MFLALPLLRRAAVERLLRLSQRLLELGNLELQRGVVEALEREHLLRQFEVFRDETTVLVLEKLGGLAKPLNVAFCLESKHAGLSLPEVPIPHKRYLVTRPAEMAKATATPWR